MAITYNKLLALLDEKGITSYTVKKAGTIGQATWKKIHEGGHIDTRTINALCALLIVSRGIYWNTCRKMNSKGCQVLKKGKKY